MLFTTLGQGWLFLIFLDIGILCALLFRLFSVFPKWLKNSKKLKKIDEKCEKISKKSAKIEFLAPVRLEKKIKKPKKFNLNSPVFSALKTALIVLICGAIIYLNILWLNYGEVRAYLILAFVVGFCLERTIFAKLIKKYRNYAIIKTK